MEQPTWFRWSLVLTISVLSVNTYFSYHMPGAIAAELIKNWGITTADIGLLFTVYSVPNLFMVLLSGILIDKWGIVKASLVLNLLCVIGNLIFALAPPENPLPYLVVGRVIFGFGGESMVLCQQFMCGRWFNGKFLNFSFGFALAFVQLFGSAAAFLLLPKVPLQPALWITVAVNVVSYGANIVYCVFEARGQRYLPTPDDTDADADADAGAEAAESGVGAIRGWFRQLCALPPSFFLVLAMVFTLSSVLYTFTAFGPLYFMQRWGLSRGSAGDVTSLLYVTILLAPFIGTLVDRTGYRTVWQLAAATLIPLCFLTFRLTKFNPAVGMAALGCLYAVTESNSYAMIPLLVPTPLLGTAYGLVGMSLNTSLFIEPYIVGLLRHLTGSFNPSTDMFIAITATGAVAALLLLIQDAFGPRVLFRPPGKEAFPSGTGSGSLITDPLLHSVVDDAAAPPKENGQGYTFYGSDA